MGVGWGRVGGGGVSQRGPVCVGCVGGGCVGVCVCVGGGGVGTRLHGVLVISVGTSHEKGVNFDCSTSKLLESGTLPEC